MYAKCNPHYAEMVDWFTAEQERLERERAESAAQSGETAPRKHQAAEAIARADAALATRPIRQPSRSSNRLTATDRGRVPDRCAGGLAGERQGDVYSAGANQPSGVSTPHGGSGQTDERQE